jgi:hypothetical protein
VLYPLSYTGIIPVAGIEPAITRVRGEVTVVFTTGQSSCFKQTRRGIDEESRLGARFLQVPCDSGLRPRPWNSDPRQGRRPARRFVLARSISPLSPPAKQTNAASPSNQSLRPLRLMVREHAVTGRACAHEESNLPARRPFLPREVTVANHH